MRHSRRSRFPLGVVALGAMSLIIHLAVVIPIEVPTTFEDEYVVIGLARHLALGGPEPLLNKYYPGLAIATAPIFHLADDPLLAFRFAQIVNAIAVASMAPMAYALARRLCPTASTWVFGASAILAMLYPAYLVTQSVVWSEALAAAGVLALALIGSIAWEHNNIALRFALGLLSGVLPLIHQRLAVAAIALAAVVALRAVLKKTWTRTDTATAFGVVLGLAVTYLALIWTGVPLVREQLASGGQGDSMADLARIGSLMVGHWFYLAAGTGGLVIVGITAVWWWRPRGSAPSPGAPWLVATMMSVAALGSVLVSAWFLRYGTRADMPVYGRYAEVFAVPLCVIGVATLATRPRREAIVAYAIGGAMVAVTAIGSLLRFGPIIESDATNMNNIVAFAPAASPGTVNLLTATAIGVLLTALVGLVALRTSYTLIAVGAIACVWVVAAASAFGWTLLFSRDAANWTMVVDEVAAIEASRGAEFDCVGIVEPIGEWERWHYSTQLLGRAILPASIAGCDQAVIARQGQIVEGAGYVLVASDPTMPSDTQRELWVRQG